MYFNNLTTFTAIMALRIVPQMKSGLNFFGMCLQTKTLFVIFKINLYIIWNILTGARLHLAR